AISGFRAWWPYRYWLLAVVVIGCGTAIAAARTEQGVALLDKAWRAFGRRTEDWGATGRLIPGYPLLGAGPGNFGRVYPRYMAPHADEKIQDPHNFALEMWATCGVIALGALAFTLVAFFFKIAAAVGGGFVVPPSGDSGPPPPEGGTT